MAAAGSSSFSKISSANLILAESGGAESAKIGPGQKVPVGFSGSSSTAKTAAAGKSAGSRPLAASEQEPSGNRLEGGELTTTPEGNFSKMYFETDNHTTIASQVGSIAVLPCAVRNIGEGVVSVCVCVCALDFPYPFGPRQKVLEVVLDGLYVYALFPLALRRCHG